MTTPSERTRSDGIGLGAGAISAAVVGTIGVCLPWMSTEVAGIVLLIAAFMLSGLALARERRTWLGFFGLGIAILGTIAGVVMFMIGFMNGSLRQSFIGRCQPALGEIDDRGAITCAACRT